MVADRTAAEQRIGTTLNGKYVLEALLGVGGMAAVYRGRHRNGNRVAVKMLHGALSSNADIRERFLREGYVANKVEHRGAVRVLDDDVAEDGSVFLVMELLEGETVDARWARLERRLAPREVAEIAHQLLDVLSAAHEKGIVHRDIKPENLFLTSDGVLKVLDFGIARLRDPLSQGSSAATRTGRMLGTPAYMPPEQVLGRSREIDGQSDLWSVGATMFSLIAGRFVHEADTVEALLVYAGSRPAPAVTSVAPHVPPAMASVVDRALQFEKGARWPTARAMEVALEQAYLATFGAPIPGARSARGHVATDAFAPTALATSGPARPSAKPAASTTGGLGDVAAVTNRSSSRVVVKSLAVVVSVALAAGIGTVLFVRGREPATHVASAPAASSMPAASAPVAPSAPATASAATVASAAPIDSSSTIEAGVAPAPSSSSSASQPSKPPPSHPAAPASPQHGAASPKSNCDPPYTIDNAGRRIPKPECL